MKSSLSLVSLVALIVGFVDPGTAWGQAGPTKDDFSVAATSFHAGGTPDSGLNNVSRVGGGDVVFTFDKGSKNQVADPQIVLPRIGAPLQLTKCGVAAVGGASLEFFMREIPHNQDPPVNTTPLITQKNKRGIGIFGVAFCIVVTGVADASFTNVFTDWSLEYTPAGQATQTYAPKISRGAATFKPIIDTADPAPIKATINATTFAFYDVLHFPGFGPGDRSNSLGFAFGPGDKLVYTAKCDTFVKVDCPGPPAALVPAAHVTWSAKASQDIVGPKRSNTQGFGQANFAGAAQATSTWIVNANEAGGGHDDAAALQVLSDAQTNGAFTPFANSPAGDIVRVP